jgi:hypothetical protein
MVAWTDLLLPILLSTVFVFVASSLVHMVFKWHNPDYRRLSNEDEVRAAIRKGSPTPGQYVFPHCLEGKDMADPAMQQKFVDGPVGVLYVKPNGAPQIGPFLLKWIVYTVVVSALAAYLARATLHAGDAYLRVFQVVGASAWLAYAWQGPSDSIWKGKPWVITFRGMFDGLIYAALTAGTFAWLWPRVLS